MSLPWLRDAWLQITADFHQQRLGHAHCIPERNELGAEAFTQALVDFLLCLAPDKRACGQCKSCLLRQSGTHPDYYLLASEDNKAIGVDKIRELTSQLQHTASQHGAKVAWIKNAEQMSVAAANALLKTLEEPTANTYLILSPKRSSQLLPTLRSRMRLHRLPEPSAAEVEAWLTKQLQRSLKEHEQQLLKRYAQAPLQVLAMLKGDKLTQQDHLGYVNQLAEALFTEQALPIPSKTDWDLWLTASELLLQELIRIKQRVAGQRLFFPDLQPAAQRWLQNQQVGLTELYQSLALCYDLRKVTGEQAGLNVPLLLQQQWLTWINKG